MRWNHYKLQQLSLLQSAMDSYYKLRQLFYYKVRHGLLQIATGITKCDDYYKLRQYNLPFCSPKNQVTPPPPPTQAINNDRSLRVVNYICIIYLFVLAQGAPLSLSKRKVPQVPNEKRFIKEGLFKEFFLLRFRFRIYCSFNFIMTSIILLSKNSRKRL